MAEKRAIARGTPTTARKSTMDFSKSTKPPRDVPPPANDADAADPERGNYFRVTVNKLFMAHGELFRPGITYRVSPDIYHGTLSEDPYKGTAFKDLCQTVEQVQ